MTRRILASLGVCAVVAVIGFQVTAWGQAPAPPKPGPEHQRLAYFVGTWTSEGEVGASPMGPAGKVTQVDTCEWFEGHFSVVCHSEGKSPTGPMKSLGILSYSPEEKIYTYYATDNSGWTSTTVPRGTVQGDTWTFNDEGMMGGQKYKSRSTLKELSPTSYSFTTEVQGPDGKWAPYLTSKNTKK